MTAEHATTEQANAADQRIDEVIDLHDQRTRKAGAKQEAIRTQKHVARWEYESHEHDATCAIDGAVCYVLARFRHNGRTFPDVNDIEDWLIERVRAPLTAEGLLDELAYHWSKISAIEVRCASESHGTITVSNAIFD